MEITFTFIFLWTMFQTLCLITLDISGIIRRYDDFARSKNWVEFCDFCFSFHISWISAIFFITLVPEYHFMFGSSLFMFLPVTACLSLFTFSLYRLLQRV